MEIELFKTELSFHFILRTKTSVKHISGDPDQVASQKSADLYLHCFQKRINLGFSTVKG